MSYSKKRYFIYFFITIFVMVTPFITINENHLLLLSFERLQFHFLGVSYNVNELYVMPFFINVFIYWYICNDFYLGKNLVWMGLSTNNF